MIERALISVSDKRGVSELARALHARGIEIISTGGTARALEDEGVAVRRVEDVTGSAEILDGRVKTLHPAVHAGILARPSEEHEAELRARGLGRIDLVAVNLYPFERAVAAGAGRDEAVENIDVGGPAMVRAAAKNHERVAVVVDPDDYDEVIRAIGESGEIGPDARRRLAAKAFSHTAAYDAEVARYLAMGGEPGGAPFPEMWAPRYERARILRYGENPHQAAAFYREVGGAGDGAPSGAPGVGGADVLQGKPLSYNNLLDVDAALACCLAFEGPAVAIVKHTNPCGIAVDSVGPAAAYDAARRTDPSAAFGGIVGVNREVDGDLADRLVETFLECVIAPGFSPRAREILAAKPSLRLLAAGPGGSAHAVRSVAGGLLVQTADAEITPARSGRVVTARQPTEEEIVALDFAWRAVWHVKSNAIVFARGTRTVAVGAGQMSRIDAARLCAMKAAEPLAGTAAASDAFFPFRDGLDALADAGATAVIQPGGSRRDDEVIAAADERGLAMIFTGERHFRH